jgi:hypothetical protein
MLFLYLVYRNIESEFKIILKESFQDSSWKVLLCLPCYNEQKVKEIIGNNLDMILDSSWRDWVKKCIEIVDVLHHVHLETIKNPEQQEITKEQEKNIEDKDEKNKHEQGKLTESKNKKEKEKEPQKEKEINSEDQSERQFTESQNELENIKFTVVEENTKLTNMLHKISMFKTNVIKIQNNLQSIKKYKLPTNLSSIPPPVFASERPSRSTEVLSYDDCKHWLKNKSINPKTNRKIDIDGPTYKKFQLMSQMYGLLK